MLVFSFIISIVINLLTKYPYHTIPGDSPIRTAKPASEVLLRRVGYFIGTKSVPNQNPSFKNFLRER